MATNSNGTASLSDELSQAVSTHWRDNGFPIVLSVLGGRLSENAMAALRVENVTLRKYIKENLGLSIRLTPVGETVEVASPTKETQSLSDNDLVSLYRTHKPENRSSATRFHPAIWQSFLAPLEGRRFIRKEPSGGFETVEECDASDDCYEVLESDLPEFDAQTGRAAWGQIRTAIKKWAARNGLELDQIGSSESPIEGHKTERRDVSARSPLEGLIDALASLTQSERQRVAIPADVLVSLLERSR